MNALLDKIDKDITTAIAEALKAEEEYLSASDPQQGVKWENIWRERWGKEMELREQRNAVVFQSLGAGVHPPHLLFAAQYLEQTPVYESCHLYTVWPLLGFCIRHSAQPFTSGFCSFSPRTIFLLVYKLSCDLIELVKGQQLPLAAAPAVSVPLWQVHAM